MLQDATLKTIQERSFSATQQSCGYNKNKDNNKQSRWFKKLIHDKAYSGNRLTKPKTNIHCFCTQQAKLFKNTGEKD